MPTDADHDLLLNWIAHTYMYTRKSVARGSFGILMKVHFTSVSVYNSNKSDEMLCRNLLIGYYEWLIMINDFGWRALIHLQSLRLMVMTEDERLEDLRGNSQRLLIRLMSTNMAKIWCIIAAARIPISRVTLFTASCGKDAAQDSMTIGQTSFT